MQGRTTVKVAEDATTTLNKVRVLVLVAVEQTIAWKSNYVRSIRQTFR